MSTDMDIDAILADSASDAPDPETPPGVSWDDLGLAATVAGVLDGTLVRPTPTIGIIDGCTDGLIYPGKVHVIHGEAGGGKSYIVTYIVAQEIDKGHHVVWVDLEDDESTLVRRLIGLGCSGDDIVAYLHYKKPSEPSQVGVTHLWATVEAFHPTLVVIDSTGESMAMDGVKQNDDDAVATWMRYLARMTSDLGPAVVLVDHVPKAATEALMPIGSQRKSAGLNGAAYLVRQKVAFSADKTGFAQIVCGKDRSGNWAKSQVVAEFHFDHVRKEFSLREHAKAPTAADGGFRPTALMEKVSTFLEHSPGSSKNAIASGVIGKRDVVFRAIEVLIAEGYVITAAGSGKAVLHTLVKRYYDPQGVVMVTFTDD